MQRLTLALMLLCALFLKAGGAEAQVRCFISWHVGTPVLLSTADDPAVTLTFLAPGYGANADTCTTNPMACETFACADDKDAPDCLGTKLGFCYAYLVDRCSRTETVITKIQVLDSVPCP